MSFYKNFRFHSFSFYLLIAGLMLLIPFSFSCTAFSRAENDEESTLRALRQITKDGKLPAESYVLSIENRYVGSKTGTLAKLLRARIRFENKDFGGAADILNSDVFRQKTTVGDYALWLRGKALQESGRTNEAMNVFAELVRDFPNSMRTREAKLLWSEMALQSGKASEIPGFLTDLNSKYDGDSLLLTARSYEQTGDRTQAVNFYRETYIYGTNAIVSAAAEAKLKGLGESLAPQTEQESLAWADKLYDARKYKEASEAYLDLLRNFPTASIPQINLKRLIAYSKSRQMPDAQVAFNMIPLNAVEKEEGFYELATGYAKAKQWADVQKTVNEMRERFPNSKFTPKTLVDVGIIAHDQRNSSEESFYLKTALAVYPDAVEIADAQFELAWNEHESRDFTKSSEMLIEHLARYVHKDSSNRGKAGYWAARDTERIGKIDEACAIYEATNYRYGANWYGYLANQRLLTLQSRGKCKTPPRFPAGSLVPRAVENLKIVTVAPETATAKELARTENAEELSTIGLFDWAIEELNEAKKTADNSPKINLALAKHYQLKGSNVRALLALKESYPDYSQMFPEEMGREEWAVFYPLSNWKDIKLWAGKRELDPYQVAGFIRQETIFEPNAKSSANAYGLMQLLIPTARSMARKYNADVGTIYASTLFDPSLNIELGTAYMRDQFTKYGRVEYVAVAYNAGPGRVVSWRKTLPIDMDEFVEEIPFNETRNYVQGIIRNSAQYRRLYDMNGNFNPNVGARPLRGKIDSMPSDQFAKEFPEVRLDNSNAE
jgi:soluble lytic murein transglycosylase